MRGVDFLRALTEVNTVTVSGARLPAVRCTGADKPWEASAATSRIVRRGGIIVKPVAWKSECWKDLEGKRWMEREGGLADAERGVRRRTVRGRIGQAEERSLPVAWPGTEI